MAASGADEALTMSRRYGGRIHLLLTDVIMPGLSGPNLAARLLQQNLDQEISAADKVEMLAKVVGKDAKVANRAAASGARYPSTHSSPVG